jgi:hypothetical protein
MINVYDTKSVTIIRHRCGFGVMYRYVQFVNCIKLLSFLGHYLNTEITENIRTWFSSLLGVIK